jgi:hypothetical protein
MISSWWKNKKSFACQGALLQPFAKLRPNSPENGFSGYRILPLLKKAWVLFRGISPVDRWRFAGAYFILALARLIQERTYFDGPWQSFLFWFIHLVISTWALAVFLLPEEHRARWKGNLVGVGIYIFLLDLLCQLPWLLIFYGSLLTGIGVGWVLKYIHLPILYGKLTPDLLILIVPLILFLVAGLLFQWFLLGLSLVIPLMLDQKTGIWPAVRSSLSFTRGYRLQLFLLFCLVAVLIGAPVLFTSAGKLMVQCLPYTSFSILPPSSLGVWICFILQTVVLLFGTFLAVWLWPLGSALWAVLYLERWKPNGNCKS